MYRMWKVTNNTGGFAPYWDAPDAAGVGGGADLSDAGDGSQPPAGDVADVEAGVEGDALESERGEAPEDLLLDDEDEDQRARPAEERIKALAKKNRKIRKQLAKLLPLSKRLEGVDLDDLVLSKRQLMQLSEQIRNNPHLRALIHGDANEPEKGRRTPAAADAEDEQFDESNLPFDPTANDTNKYFAKLARENFENQKLLKQLQQQVNGVDGRDRARTEGQIRDTWKTTILSAATHIKDDGVAVVFKDLLASAYKDPDVRKQYTPQQLVSHYLKVLKIDPAEAAKANAAAAKTGPGTGAMRTAATQQRIAEQNKSLPRTAAVTGSPAPARSDRPTLGSLRKQVAATGR